MVRECNFNNHKYWVTVEPAIHDVTKETIYIAYVSDSPPGGLFYGEIVRDHEGRVMLFGNENIALTNAKAVKESYLQ